MNTPQERNAERRKRIRDIITTLDQQKDTWKLVQIGAIANKDSLRIRLRILDDKLNSVFLLDLIDQLGFCMEPEPTTTQEHNDGTI